MNPAIVIPSYWTAKSDPQPLGEPGAYDHATPYDKPLPELETCLESLDRVRGVVRTIVLVVAPPAGEQAARARVEGICRRHPDLNPLVIGSAEANVIRDASARVAPGMDGETISLRGYGAIRNMGLVACAILGHDVAVFLDDDEAVLDDEFLIDAVYGLGQRTHQNLPLIAKTGYFLNREDSPYAAEDHIPWKERLWSKHEGFNEAMRTALTSTRISRSSVCCGGCLALHAQAFSEVPFDPYITRGEDLDYLLNLRMAGLELWFDNAWRVRHHPPATPSAPSRFLQDAYRWLYEAAKLKAAADHPGIRALRSSSLEPYPGVWVSDAASSRITRTALRHVIAGPDRSDYAAILFHSLPGARTWARDNSGRYFGFIRSWKRVVATLWQESALERILLESGTPKQRAPQEEIPWTAFSTVPEVGTPLRSIPEIGSDGGGARL